MGGARAGHRPADRRQGARVALPYIGLGYTSLSAREGWGLSADIGLVASAPASACASAPATRRRRSSRTMLNDLRLAPVIQLGVSYAF